MNKLILSDVRLILMLIGISVISSLLIALIIEIIMTRAV